VAALAVAHVLAPFSDGIAIAVRAESYIEAVSGIRLRCSGLGRSIATTPVSDPHDMRGSDQGIEWSG
jgi:hypothetical protein